MRAIDKVAVVIGTVGIVSGSFWMLEPHVDRDRPTPYVQHLQEKRDRDLADLGSADHRVEQRRRDRLADALEAERRQRDLPGEHRPPPVDPPRFRWFPR